jgi:hypothetical protein
MHDTVEDLYPAVRACTSIDDWNAAADANAGAISAGVDPETFLGNACGSASAGLGSTTLCKTVKAACATNQSLAITAACLPES